MAIVEIKKLELAGLNIERDRILSALSDTKVFEISKTREIEGTGQPADISGKSDEITGKMARLMFGINFVNDRLNEIKGEQARFEKIKKKPKLKEIDYIDYELGYKPEKKPFMGGRTIIGRHEFETVYTREYELFGTIDELEKINYRFAEIASAQNKKRQLLRELSPYRGTEFKFSDIKNTKTTSTAIGLLPFSRYYDIADIRGEYPAAQFVLNQNGKYLTVFIAAMNDFDSILARLSEIGFTRCVFDFDSTPEEKYIETLNGLKELRREYLDLLNTVPGYIAKYKEFQIYYDYLMVETDKTQAAAGLAVTGHAFVLEGFFPAYCEERVKNAVYSITNAVNLEIRAVTEEDEPPTLMKNAYLIEPYEAITEMYSPPKYGEVDPNMFVAFFYFMFFGIMMGDAGYGLLLSLATLIILRFCKVEKGTRKLMMIICMGGVSTIAWGILFGGVFGISAVKPLWFNPIEQPMTLLIFSLALGLLQVLFGLGIKAYSLIKSGKPWSALFDVGFLYLLFAGLGCLAGGMMLKIPALSTAGTVMTLAAVAGMICTQGRQKKKFFGKVVGGFASLYNLINYISDILSYCRIFGLGLATGVIAMVANMLAVVMIDLIPVAGYLVAIFILLLLHGINIGINTLGTYIHTARLQFIEFFGKFYEGGGRMFRPLGSVTKFTRTEETKLKILIDDK